MGNIKSFDDLDVWQMGKALTHKIYELTVHFRKEEV
ncbi:four helix bundle protein [Desulfobacterota bacterium AH_259_B03_O07]|nr:four helix bundle protein [Desulfobacterota bacterium AH_259_B03_O07]